jgi:ubiquinone/menaquinone biosynthesis C-methylase UbiE
VNGQNSRIAEIWAPAQECCDAAWEAAYLRFETQAEEVRKFRSRLKALGAASWSRDLAVVELFCGRGSGLQAWQELGFTRLEGVDISAGLLAQYAGDARLYVGDCRELKLPDASRDLLCIQGGLHHLPALPEDMAATVAEVRRVLRPGGQFLIVEPWLTPFLSVVHAAGRSRGLRRVSPKLDALACMIEHEHKTYSNWLGRPAEIEAALMAGFQTEYRRVAWGKFSWVGRKL